MMQEQSLQFAAALNAEAAANITRTLEAIAGVSHVTVAPAENRVRVAFDEDRTSTQELLSTLTRAGYAVRAPSARHGAGSCCGGCGG